MQGVILDITCSWDIFNTARDLSYTENSKFSAAVKQDFIKIRFSYVVFPLYIE